MKATMVEIGNQQIRYLIIGYKCFVSRCFRYDPANSGGLVLLPLVPMTEARRSQQDHFASWLVLINLHQPGSYTSTDCTAWSNFEQFDTLACCGRHLDLHLDLHVDDLLDYPRDHHNPDYHPANRPVIRNTSSKSLLDQFPAIQLIGLLWTGTLWGAVDLVGDLYHNNWIWDHLMIQDLISA